MTDKKNVRKPKSKKFSPPKSGVIKTPSLMARLKEERERFVKLAQNAQLEAEKAAEKMEQYEVILDSIDSLIVELDGQ